jgi:hypothetical protein
MRAVKKSSPAKKESRKCWSLVRIASSSRRIDASIDRNQRKPKYGCGFLLVCGVLFVAVITAAIVTRFIGKRRVAEISRIWIFSLRSSALAQACDPVPLWEPARAYA